MQLLIPGQTSDCHTRLPIFLHRDWPVLVAGERIEANFNKFLKDNLVDEFILVKSNKTHQTPVPSDFNLENLKVASTQTWGDEEVTIYTR